MASTPHRHRNYTAAIVGRLALLGVLSSIALAFSAASAPIVPASASQPSVPSVGAIQIASATTITLPIGDLHTGG
jgi:hypothetical protein